MLTLSTQLSGTSALAFPKDRTSADCTPKRDGVLDRTLSILSLFEHDFELTLTEISVRVGLPKSTVHRLTATLCERGLLEGSSRSYRLGIRLFEMGNRVSDVHHFIDAAQPYVRDLAEGTRGTVNLEIPDGTESLCLSQINRRGTPTRPTRVGGKLPMHLTASGKMMLALSDSSALRGYLAEPLERRTKYSISDPARLTRGLSRIRAQGIAVEREELALGIASIAVPIVLDDDLVGTISVSYWATRLTKRDLDCLRTAGRTLSAELSNSASDAPQRNWTWLRPIGASAPIHPPADYVPVRATASQNAVVTQLRPDGRLR